MKSDVEGLWSDYLSDECARIDTDEERRLVKGIVTLHDAVNGVLDDRQRDLVDRYVDELLSVQAAFAKKAFFKGCEFATSFMCEMMRHEG